MTIILPLKNFPFKPAVPDSNCNILIYYTFTLFQYLNIHSGLLYFFGFYSCNFCKVVILTLQTFISLRACIAIVLLCVVLLYCYCVALCSFIVLLLCCFVQFYCIAIVLLCVVLLYCYCVALCSFIVLLLCCFVQFYCLIVALHKSQNMEQAINLHICSCLFATDDK